MWRRKRREVGVGVEGKLMRWDKGVKHKLDFFLCSEPSVKHYDGKPSLDLAPLRSAGVQMWHCFAPLRPNLTPNNNKRMHPLVFCVLYEENQRHALTDLKLPTNYTATCRMKAALNPWARLLCRQVHEHNTSQWIYKLADAYAHMLKNGLCVGGKRLKKCILIKLEKECML